MILMPDLFSFAYVPNWYSQLAMLAEMALPEPWRFKNPTYLTKNPDTPILERYIHAIFKKQLIDYKEERIPSNAARFFHIENEFCCFHTGLYTRRYKAIYACFDRNKKKAHYSLDREDGIENDALARPLTPEEVLEQKQLRKEVYTALMQLPSIQARRIYARFYLGMAVKEIAQIEGVDRRRVWASIRRGLKKLAYLLDANK